MVPMKLTKNTKVVLNKTMLVTLLEDYSKGEGAVVEINGRRCTVSSHAITSIEPRLLADK
jgi:hypothetical protein